MIPGTDSESLGTSGVRKRHTAITFFFWGGDVPPETDLGFHVGVR